MYLSKILNAKVNKIKYSVVLDKIFIENIVLFN